MAFVDDQQPPALGDQLPEHVVRQQQVIIQDDPLGVRRQTGAAAVEHSDAGIGSAPAPELAHDLRFAGGGAEIELRHVAQRLAQPGSHQRFAGALLPIEQVVCGRAEQLRELALLVLVKSSEQRFPLRE